MSPHVLGIVGEFCNLVGGLILAGDVLFRQKQRARRVKLSALSEFAAKHELSGTYKGLPAASIDLEEMIVDQQVTFWGWIGVGFLLVGFALLIGYHFEAIMAPSEVYIQH
jgi:hypothetical protein